MNKHSYKSKKSNTLLTNTKEMKRAIITIMLISLADCILYLSSV